MTQKVSIQFQGICSHFRGVVPGVPHRVVLPDASAARSGMVIVGNDDAWIPYALMPHIAAVFLPDLPRDQQLTIPRFMAGGVLLDGLRIQIANAVDSRMSYDKGYDQVPAISDYVPNANFSSEVVLGGRAAMYFDFFGGTASLDVRGREMGMEIVVETEGDPVLLITPFEPREEPGESAWGETHPVRAYRMTVATDRLIVGNFDVCTFEDPTADFLWHFMTVRGGIPAKLSARPPGAIECTDLAAALKAQAEHARLLGQAIEGTLDLAGVAAMPFQPSCSDSRYP
jgi:hypothetical protein